MKNDEDYCDFLRGNLGCTPVSSYTPITRNYTYPKGGVGNPMIVRFEDSNETTSTEENPFKSESEAMTLIKDEEEKPIDYNHDDDDDNDIINEMIAKKISDFKYNHPWLSDIPGLLRLYNGLLFIKYFRKKK